MLPNEIALKEFGSVIQKLINRENMTRQKTQECFREILLNEQPELHQGAFLSALVAKQESVDEIAGAWQAIISHDTVKLSGVLPENLFENSGTGMDRLKTFNVSSAAAIVASAAGVPIARHGARALSSVCGTVDILEAIGINVECDAAVVESSIINAGIGIFNGMSAAIHPGGLFRILSQIRFGSTLNIAASLANPAFPTMAIRGVYTPDLLRSVTNVMKEIGYKKGMVVHGFDSENKPAMDEISILGPTQIHSFAQDYEDIEFFISPSDFGIAVAQYEDIAPCTNLSDEANRFVTVLAGKGFPSCIDFTSLNSAAILKVADKASSLREGFEISKSIIKSGKAIDKLHEWIKCQSYEDGRGLTRFEKLMR